VGTYWIDNQLTLDVWLRYIGWKMDNEYEHPTFFDECISRELRVSSKKAISDFVEDYGKGLSIKKCCEWKGFTKG